MIPPCFRALAVAGIVLVPSAGSAQVIEPGMRIRITQMDGYRRVGEVVTIRPDSALVIAAGMRQFAVPLPKVLSVDASAGRTRHFWEHFLQVVALGAVTGGVANALGHILGSEQQQEEAVIRGAAIGAAVAAPLGIVVGYTRGTERWTPILHPVVSPTCSVRFPCNGPPPATGRNR